MSTQEGLFHAFSTQTLAEWQAKIEQDLKGKPLSSLQSTDADGNAIAPAYTHENSRLRAQPFKAMARWDTVQELFVSDAKTANREALDHLNQGATSLLFYLFGDCNLEMLLKDIEIQYIRVNFVVEGDALALSKRLIDLMESRGLEPIEIAGSINIDCLENLARTGNWQESKTADFRRAAILYDLLPENIRGLCVNVNLFANAGASPAQQLGIALSMVYEYIYELHLNTSRGFWINFAVGGDYFGEIAKLRAFRRLWAQLHAALEIEETEAFIYAETSMRNKTILDRYNNMVRSTSEAMAAIIGGANEISIKGFNHTYKAPDAFGERIAKNQLSILEHESHLETVLDMAQGAYFIEDLTEQSAEKGWAFFKAVEKEGGFVKSMESGWLQKQVEATARKEQEAFDTGQKVLIGANKYVQRDEKLKAFIEQGHFAASREEKTTVRKIITRRLSEGLEQ